MRCWRSWQEQFNACDPHSPYTSSTIRTPNVSAMIFSVLMVTLLAPRSISPNSLTSKRSFARR